MLAKIMLLSNDNLDVDELFKRSMMTLIAMISHKVEGKRVRDACLLVRNVYIKVASETNSQIAVSVLPM